MSDAKKARRKGPRRRERRHLPTATPTTRAVTGVGFVGCAVLGAGVYAQWMRETPLEYGPWLVAGGAVAVAVALWFGESSADPVRVGDAGVAVEQGEQVARLEWWEIERIRLTHGSLEVKGKALTLTLPLDAHGPAVAAVLAEARRRVPDVLDVKDDAAQRLPAAEGGEEVAVTGARTTGLACAASGEPITFEKDARFCPNCGAAYLARALPATCTRCQAALGEQALQA